MYAYIHNKRIYTFNTCIRTFYVRLCTFKQISVQTHAGLLIAGALHFTMQTITWENGKLREKRKGKAASAKRKGFLRTVRLNSVCFCYFATSNDSGVGVAQLPYRVRLRALHENLVVHRCEAVSLMWLTFAMFRRRQCITKRSAFRLFSHCSISITDSHSFLCF